MNIDILPTIQFWKNKQLLWEHRGVSQLDQDLSEGGTPLQHAVHKQLSWLHDMFHYLTEPLLHASS